MTASERPDRWGARFAVLFGLSGLAVAQPLLDLYGANPELFLAAGASRSTVLGFVAVVVLGVPMVAVATCWIVGRVGGWRWGTRVHVAWVALLGAGVGLVLARGLGLRADAVVWPLALALGFAIAWAHRRLASLHLGLRYLAVAPVGFVALFLIGSRSSDLVWQGQAAAAEVSQRASPPIVWIVLDEFNLAALLDADGNVDAARFPRFAELSERATWYRDATSVAPQTPVAVPAIVTGLYPDPEKVAFSADYPHNLFTLLGGRYELDVFEMVTSLCPPSLCSASSGARPPSSVRSFAQDVAVVFGHRVLPDASRDRLPSVSGAWAGFTGTGGDPAGDVTVERGDDAFAKWKEAGAAERDPAVQTAHLDALIDGIGAGAPDRPTLSFAHVTLPHRPWLLTEQGQRYEVPKLAGIPAVLGANGVDPDTDSWIEDPVFATQGLQRSSMQTAWVDQVIGRVIDRLDDKGLWDDAFVVVTADHGVSFEPGSPLRRVTDPAVVQDMYRVPLFVKVPGQQSGGRDDRNVLTVDLLPTLVDALDIDVDWTFDGRSLLVDGPIRTDKPVFWRVGPKNLGSVTVDDLLTRARSYRERLPGEGRAGLAGPGPYGALVGTAVSRVEHGPRAAGSFELDQLDGFAAVDTRPNQGVPALLTGRIRGTGRRPEWLLLAIDGRIAGVLSLVRSTGDRYTGLLATELLQDGRNEVTVWWPDGPADPGDGPSGAVTLSPVPVR